MSERQIKEYYERIEKLLNGANKETYGFAPQEIKNILRSYEELQNQNQELKKQLDGIIEERDYLFNKLNTENKWLIVENKKLKKQLEEKTKEYVFIGNAQNKTRDFINQITKDNKKYKNQQKEFIEWLSYRIDYGTESISYRDSFREVLQKFKEIIGGKDDNK